MAFTHVPVPQTGLRETLKDMRLSFRWLSKQTGASESHLYKISSGHSFPSRSLKWRIEQALDCMPDIWEPPL